jgi:hypothetical protein
MTARVLIIIALTVTVATAQTVDLNKLPSMDYSDWPEVTKLTGRHVEAIDVALHAFREYKSFSTSGDLKHFTVELRRRGDKLAVSFFPEYHERSSRSLPGRNKYGTYITYFVSLSSLKVIAYTFERD